MVLISLLILIVAIALPSFKTQLSPILITRISTILLIYSGALALNAFYIQSIGSGIGIYSGLFHITTISQQLDIFWNVRSGSPARATRAGGRGRDDSEGEENRWPLEIDSRETGPTSCRRVAG